MPRDEEVAGSNLVCTVLLLCLSQSLPLSGVSFEVVQRH